ncbi:chromosome segregation ATPase [Sphingobium sp. B2D3A]|uniref:hypothetical protein n=1 Tax=unclassified Sphingobium TaxID=2611147 RepID=UPI002223F457|nr:MULTISPECIES: hypothetical protein [unclassified Sphingobium]MCW2338501.1 chromosome segregation ATPase [Sphingobium sp. B2D3A]MCW2384959.1 chromosome segregation ATPase [Sphingobium sp. B2D3D]
MKNPTNGQVDSTLDPVSLALASLEVRLSQREREMDVLTVQVDRYRRKSEAAEARAAMLQASLDRHLLHCGRDEGATQRLIGELAEATARRKEQVAMIERRNQRIIALQQELDKLKRQGGISTFFTWLRRALSFRRA